MAIQINGTSGISGVDGSAGTPALQGTDSNTGISFGTDEVNINTGGSTRATVDSSGRLLVGTSSARSNVYQSALNITPQNQIESNKGNYSGGLSLINCSAAGQPAVLTFGQSYTNTLGGNALIANNEFFGLINFTGNDGTNFRTGAQISALVDGTPGAGDMPGRLVFSTTADGASSPTERMRITSTGDLRFNSGYGSVATAYGVRAWVTFSNTGSIIADGNVTSVSKASPSNFTINFTSSFTDNKYCIVGMGDDNTNGGDECMVVTRDLNMTKSTTACTVKTVVNWGGATSRAVYGDTYVAFIR
jgi:hypothetical protein